MGATLVGCVRLHVVFSVAVSDFSAAVFHISRDARTWFVFSSVPRISTLLRGRSYPQARFSKKSFFSRASPRLFLRPLCTPSVTLDFLFSVLEHIYEFLRPYLTLSVTLAYLFLPRISTPFSAAILYPKRDSRIVFSVLAHIYNVFAAVLNP